MEKHSVFIVSKDSAHSKKVISLLEREKIKFYFRYNLQELEKFILTKARDGSKNFVICGGDGTINKFVNIVMKLPKKMREQIKIGIIPCGRANDLAKNLGISLDFEEALKLNSEKRYKKIDLVKVNEDY